MFQGMKRGLISRPVSPHAPNLRAHAIASMTAPPVLNRAHIDYQPRLFRNDTLGDCTAAGLGNTLLAQAALGGFTLDIPDDKVVSFYSDTSGYVPGEPATDVGANEVDVLNYQMVNGFDTGGQVPYTGVWANIEPSNLNEMRLAMTMFGCAYLQVNLAAADMIGGTTWDTVTPASFGDPTPGSEGPHCLLAWSYTGLGDDDLVWLATWGMLVPATWKWIVSRMTGAKAIAHRQLLNARGQNFYGLDYPALEAQCQEFAASA